MSTNGLIAIGMMMGFVVLIIIATSIFVYFDDRARAREKAKIQPTPDTPMYTNTSVTKTVPLKAGEDAEAAAERIFDKAVKEHEANLSPGMFSTVTVTVEPAIGVPVTRTKTTEPKTAEPEKETSNE